MASSRRMLLPIVVILSYVHWLFALEENPPRFADPDVLVLLLDKLYMIFKMNLQTCFIQHVQKLTMQVSHWDPIY